MGEGSQGQQGQPSRAHGSRVQHVNCFPLAQRQVLAPLPPPRPVPPTTTSPGGCPAWLNPLLPGSTLRCLAQLPGPVSHPTPGTAPHAARIPKAPCHPTHAPRIPKAPRHPKSPDFPHTPHASPRPHVIPHTPHASPRPHVIPHTPHASPRPQAIPGCATRRSPDDVGPAGQHLACLDEGGAQPGQHVPQLRGPAPTTQYAPIAPVTQAWAHNTMCTHSTSNTICIHCPSSTGMGPAPWPTPTAAVATAIPGLMCDPHTTTHTPGWGRGGSRRGSGPCLPARGRRSCGWTTCTCRQPQAPTHLYLTRPELCPSTPDSASSPSPRKKLPSSQPMEIPRAISATRAAGVPAAACGAGEGRGAGRQAGGRAGGGGGHGEVVSLGSSGEGKVRAGWPHPALPAPTWPPLQQPPPCRGRQQDWQQAHGHPANPPHPATPQHPPTRREQQQPAGTWVAVTQTKSKCRSTHHSRPAASSLPATAPAGSTHAAQQAEPAPPSAHLADEGGGVLLVDGADPHLHLQLLMGRGGVEEGEGPQQRIGPAARGAAEGGQAGAGSSNKSLTRSDVEQDTALRVPMWLASAERVGRPWRQGVAPAGGSHLLEPRERASATAACTLVVRRLLRGAQVRAGHKARALALGAR